MRQDKPSVERFKIALLKHIDKQVSINVITTQKANFLREKVTNEIHHNLSSEDFATIMVEINKHIRVDFESLFRHATGQVN